MVVALALFALIAAAAAALVTSILDVQRHTDGRLARLADLQRALALIDRDLGEIAEAPLSGTGSGVAFQRHAGRLTSTISYRLTSGWLERMSDGQPQRLLDHVAGLRWRYLARSGWQDHWPTDDVQARAWPAAVDVELVTDGAPPSGPLRRVVDLPARPSPLGAVPN